MKNHRAFEEFLKSNPNATIEDWNKFNLQQRIFFEKALPVKKITLKDLEDMQRTLLLFEKHCKKVFSVIISHYNLTQKIPNLKSLIWNDETENLFLIRNFQLKRIGAQFEIPKITFLNTEDVLDKMIKCVEEEIEKIENFFYLIMNFLKSKSKELRIKVIQAIQELMLFYCEKYFPFGNFKEQVLMLKN